MSPAEGADNRTARGSFERDPLFSYPLPVPSETAYRELGLGPDASDAEVQAAKSLAVRRLDAEQRELERSLQRTYDEVPGLREAYEDVAIADRAALPDTQTRRAELEARAVEKDPEFREKRGRSAEIVRRIEEINDQALENPVNRRVYDRAHPPLALLKVEDCAVDEFLEGATRLYLLRKDVAGFLSERGVAVFHPSDLTREDFSSDFAFNPILDEGR